MKVRGTIVGSLLAALLVASTFVGSGAAGAAAAPLGSHLPDLLPIIQSSVDRKYCVDASTVDTTIPLDQTTGKDTRSRAKVVDFELDGLTTVEVMPIGSKSYVFGYRTCDGVGFVQALNPDGTLGSTGVAFDWSTGWTNIEPYQINGQTFTLEMKSGNGTVVIDAYTADAIGRVKIAETDRDNWSGGWTHAKPFAVAAGTFALFYKTGTGEVAWRQLTAAGTYARGEALPRTNIGSGWTQLETFKSGAKTYLLMSNRSTGAVRIRELTASGALGTQTYADLWTAGWDSFHVFDAGAKQYLVASKSNGDRIYVRPISGGTLAAAPTTDFPWSYVKIITAFNGTVAVPDNQHTNFTRGYTIGAKTYLLTVTSPRLTDAL